MAKTQALGICGSLRSGSWNLKLLRTVLEQMRQTGTFETSLYGNLDMPLMNEDLESKPLDASIENFRTALKQAQVVVMASPEYNGSFSSALKNAVDWGSREGNLWAGKIVLLASASPGSLGGVRGLIQLRTLMSGIKCWVVHEQVHCAFSDKAFEQDKLVNEATAKQIHGAVEATINLCKRL